MKTRKLFTFLVVVAVLFGGFIFKPSPAKAIKHFTVEVTPRVVGEVAEYKFQFTIEKKLLVHEWIKFVFPKGTKLIPSLPDDEEAKVQRLKDVIENIQFCAGAGSPNICAGLPIISFEQDGTMSMKITTWINLDPAIEGFKDICMIINKKAGITNPGTPGILTYQMATQAEPTLVESYPVEIKEQEVKSYSIDLSPKTTNTIADYTFQLTFIGTLKPNQHKGFYFPPGTTLNPPMPEEETAKKARLKDIADAFSFGDRKSLGVEGYGPPIVEYTEEGYLNIRISGGAGGMLFPDVPGGKTITMHFSTKAGICTPFKPGSYVYKFKTMLFPTMESQPVEITEKLPTPELELVAQLPVYEQTMPLFAYPSVRKVKLTNDHQGFVYVRSMEGINLDTYYVLGLYDSIDKRITKEIYLCSERDLKGAYDPSSKPAILVDENNMIYVTLKQQIYAFSNYLNLYDILEPDLDSLHISSLLRLNFFKNNSIVALRDGIVLFIDKTSGVLTDHIAIDKSIDPDIKGLKTVSLQDYTKDSILMYFSEENSKKQVIRKVVYEVDISSKEIKQKWSISKENYPKLTLYTYFSQINYVDPYIFFWTSCYPGDTLGIQLFMVNTKTNQESIMELPVCYLSDQWIEKEGETWYAYIRCPMDGTNDNLQEGIYRIVLNGFLP